MYILLIYEQKLIFTHAFGENINITARQIVRVHIYK